MEALNNLENKVDSVNNRYKSKLQNEDKEEVEKLSETEANINNIIREMKENISSVIEVDSYVGG